MSSKKTDRLGHTDFSGNSDLPRHAPGVRLAIVLCFATLTFGPAQLFAADTPATKAIKVATFVGAPPEMGPISPEGGWKEVPDLLAGAMVGKQPLPRTGKQLGVTVDAPGVALMAVLWKQPNFYGRAWDSFRPAYEAIRKQNWEPVAIAVTPDQFQTKFDRLVVFRRNVKAKEKLAFPEGEFEGPFLVTADEKKIAEIILSQPVVIPSNDLKPVKNRKDPRNDGPYRGIVALDSFLQHDSLDSRDYLLYREVLRQGLLIAARDELGLPTRDQRLGELISVGSGEKEPPLGLFYRATPSKTLAVTLFRAASPEPIAVYDFEVPLNGSLPIDAAVALSERLSRTEFVAALKGAGYKGRERKRGVTAKGRDDLDQPLFDNNFIAQFALVRKLHQEIADKGESPALISSLSRAYAHLGALTDYLWSPAHKAFEARALLYAERNVARADQAPESYWNRAYVRAIVGRHQSALEDVEKGNKLAAGKKLAPPKWVDAIDACCRFDRIQQKALSEEAPLRSLINHFGLLETEYAGTERTRMQATSRVLEETPDCFKAMHVLSMESTLGILRTAISQSFLTFSKTLYDRVQTVPGLPEAARKIVTARHDAGKDEGEQDWQKELKDRQRLVAALRGTLTSSDQGSEPSLGGLAHLIEETGFLQAWRSAYVMSDTLGLPADATVAALQPIVEGHRFADFLNSYVSDRSAREDSLKRLWPAIRSNMRDLEFTALPMVREAAVTQKNQGEGSIKFLVTRVDAVYRDYSGIQSLTEMPQQRIFEYKRRTDVSPHAPLIWSLKITVDWPSIEARATELEEKYADEILIVNAFTEHYFQVQNIEAMVRCLKREIKIDPDPKVYRRLARIYMDQGKIDEWRKTLDEFLETHESLGLEHAGIQVEIADYLMGQRDFQGALPYALQAAETYSSWGLACAARCYDGLEDWEHAEQFVRAGTERYEGDRQNWFLWCRERNRGDVEAARALANEWAEKLGNPPPDEEVMDLAAFYLVARENERALEVLEAGFKKFGDPYQGLQAALAADILGRKETRDRLLGDLGEQLKTRKPEELARKELLELAGLFAAALQPSGKFDLEAFAELRKEAAETPQEATNLDAFAGRFLLLHEMRDQGLDLLKRAATAPIGPFNRRLARVVLNDEAVEFGPDRSEE